MPPVVAAAATSSVATPAGVLQKVGVAGPVGGLESAPAPAASVATTSFSSHATPSTAGKCVEVRGGHEANPAAESSTRTKMKSSSILHRKAPTSTLDLSPGGAKHVPPVVAAAATSSVAAPAGVLQKVGVAGPVGGLKTPAVVAPSVARAGPSPIVATAPTPAAAAAATVAPPPPPALSTSVQVPPATASSLAPCPSFGANGASAASLWPGVPTLTPRASYASVTTAPLPTKVGVTGGNAPSPSGPSPPAD